MALFSNTILFDTVHVLGITCMGITCSLIVVRLRMSTYDIIVAENMRNSCFLSQYLFIYCCHAWPLGRWDGEVRQAPPTLIENFRGLECHV